MKANKSVGETNASRLYTYLEDDGAEAHEEGVAAGGAVALDVEEVLVAGLLVDGHEVLAPHLH